MQKSLQSFAASAILVIWFFGTAPSAVAQPEVPTTPGATNAAPRVALEPPAPTERVKALPNVSNFLGLSNLTINPKVIARTDEGDPTVGVEYKYERRLFPVMQARRTDVDFFIHSEGLIVAQEEKSPNRLLTHGVRLSAIDLWPSKRMTGAASDQQRALFRSIKRNYSQPWEELAPVLKQAKTAAEREGISAEMQSLLGKAQAELASFGTLRGDLEAETWAMTGHGNTPEVEWEEFMLEMLVQPHFVFLSFDVDADAETDQTFSDVQLVGQAQLRGKFLVDWFDKPFALLRGGQPPVSHLNRNGGPLFWGGAGIVDASGVETRKALTGSGDENFARAHFGVSYRTELFSGSSPARCVALELSWRYYHEFDAPAALRSQNLDDTSYFKATLLFPGNYFLEYTDGKLPLDVEGASTVSVGWRHNF